MPGQPMPLDQLPTLIAHTLASAHAVSQINHGVTAEAILQAINDAGLDVVAKRRWDSGMVPSGVHKVTFSADHDARLTYLSDTTRSLREGLETLDTFVRKEQARLRDVKQKISHGLNLWTLVENRVNDVERSVAGLSERAVTRAEKMDVHESRLSDHDDELAQINEALAEHRHKSVDALAGRVDTQAGVINDLNGRLAQLRSNVETAAVGFSTRIVAGGELQDSLRSDLAALARIVRSMNPDDAGTFLDELAVSDSTSHPDWHVGTDEIENDRDRALLDDPPVIQVNDIVRITGPDPFTGTLAQVDLHDHGYVWVRITPNGQTMQFGRSQVEKVASP